MDALVKILYIVLLIIFFKIVFIVLGTLKEKILNQMRRNKLRYGTIISRKDLASVSVGIRIKNKFLHKLAHNSLYPLYFIPYERIYDDKKATEQNDFLFWCGEFLSDQGYADVEYLCGGTDNCSDIICYKDNTPVYVQCRLLGNMLKDSVVEEDRWESLGRPDIQKIVGTMVHDNIRKGMVLTTGDFTKDALEYARSLPETVSLELIDGKELTRKVRELRGRAYPGLEEG